jgi:hypothetical protein
MCFHQTRRPSSYEQFLAWIGPKLSQEGMMRICWVWQLLARPFGRQGTVFVLTKNILTTLLRFSSLLAYAFMSYWAGLYPEATKKAIEADVNELMEMVSQMIKKNPPKVAPVLMIKMLHLMTTQQGACDDR